MPQYLGPVENLFYELSRLKLSEDLFTNLYLPNLFLKLLNFLLHFLISPS